jgi:hypothetical protein
MDCFIEGRIANQPVVEEFILNLVKELGMNRLRNPWIDVQFTNKDIGAYGLCNGDNDYAEIQIAKKCPETGRKFGFIEMMQTLAHEMVHARQFIRGQLDAEGAKGWKWKGRNAEGFQYENQPWEKEAYRLEGQLFLKCFPFEAKFTN